MPIPAEADTSPPTSDGRDRGQTSRRSSPCSRTCYISSCRSSRRYSPTPRLSPYSSPTPGRRGRPGRAATPGGHRHTPYRPSAPSEAGSFSRCRAHRSRRASTNSTVAIRSRSPTRLPSPFAGSRSRAWYAIRSRILAVRPPRRVDQRPSARAKASCPGPPSAAKPWRIGRVTRAGLPARGQHSRGSRVHAELPEQLAGRLRQPRLAQTDSAMRPPPSRPFMLVILPSQGRRPGHAKSKHRAGDRTVADQRRIEQYYPII